MDPDAGNNAKLQYQIPAGLADDKFEVDSNGVIRTTTPLDRETKSVYTFNGEYLLHSSKERVTPKYDNTFMAYPKCFLCIWLYTVCV